jgi:nitrite reductase/ring-hydroxylating ferredoxin subunit
MSDYTPVLQTPDLGPGRSRTVEIDGRAVLIVNIGQRYYALDAHCPEDGAPLELRRSRSGDTLTCPADGAAFAVPSGDRLDDGGPPLQRYDVRIEENDIEIGPPVP